jgi:hypothetical protein
MTEKFIHYLDSAINKSIGFGGKFALCSIVNKEIYIVKPEILNNVISHYTNKGFIVHAPPTKEVWERALQDAERSGLTDYKVFYKLNDSNFKKVFLIELKEEKTALERLNDNRKEFDRDLFDSVITELGVKYTDCNDNDIKRKMVTDKLDEMWLELLEEARKDGYEDV